MIWGEELVRLVERLGRGYVSMFSGFCYGVGVGRKIVDGLRLHGLL